MINTGVDMAWEEILPRYPESIDLNVFDSGPDDYDPDYVQPEEEYGISGSGRDQMSEEEFADFMSSSPP